MSYRTNFFLLSLSSSSWPLSLSYPDVLVFRILSLLILCTSLGNLTNSFKLNSVISTFLKAMHFKQTHLSLLSVAACTRYGAFYWSIGTCSGPTSLQKSDSPFPEVINCQNILFQGWDFLTASLIYAGILSGVI